MTNPIQQDIDVANMVRSDIWPNYHRHVTRYRRQIEDRQAARIAELEGEMAEYNRLFDLQWSRMTEATEAWQKATGNPDTSPDLGKLLAWLLEGRTDYVVALSLIDGVTDEVEMIGYRAEYLSQKAWAANWLAQANKLLADYMRNKEATNGK